MMEQTATTESLQKRITRLEHINRVMICGVACVSTIIAAGTIICCQNSPPKLQTKISASVNNSIQAEKFVLVSSDGRILAELGSKNMQLRGETACLTIHDAGGNERLAIGVGSNGPFAGPFFEMYGTTRQRK